MQTRALVLAAIVLAATAAPLAGRQAAGQVASSRISITEFKKAFDAGQVIILDVRDPESYAEGHIPGAVLALPDSLAKTAAGLKAATKPIVTYCA